MRVLLTGSRGHLASWVTDRAPPGAELKGLDIKNGLDEDVRGPLAARMAAQADVVLHLAALIDVAASVLDPGPTMSVNVEGTRNLAESARPGSLFVFVSSAAVYGDPIHQPVRETEPLRPTSPYGESKVQGEALVAEAAHRRGFRFVVVRPFNFYSGRQDPSNPYSGVITHFVRSCLDGKPLRIHGDGLQTRDFVHASDVADLLWTCATDERASGRFLNAGSGHAMTILALAKAVQSAVRTAVPVQHGPPRAGDIRHSCADIAEARSLGWRPRVPLDDGLRETVPGLRGRLS